jgi:glyoxylase-like metal-dependent hydrolase (beta-lactamase superfamily II)
VALVVGPGALTRVVFSPRPGPSANIVLMTGERPVLVDAGSGSVPSDAALRAFLAGHGVAPEDLAWLALTHFHADHAGGAASLQRDHGVPVAAHATEAALVNARDPRACDARFLGFPVGPFTVQRALADGDVLDGLHVVHAPGQTPGHVAYWLPEQRIAITGDLLQAGDVSWIPFAGPWAAGALERTRASVERIAALRPRLVLPGHGPPVRDVPAALALARERYAAFAAEPERAVWHAVRRATVSHLMIADLAPSELAALPWAVAAADALGLTAEALIARSLAGLAERGTVVAAAGGRYTTTVPHERRGPPAVGPGDPSLWDQ